jgi:hypothetical protein
MTRKVSRMYKSKLFGSNPINPREAQEWNMWIIYAHFEEANDYLVESMTNLTSQEIDNLSQDEFDRILEKINKIKHMPWK